MLESTNPDLVAHQGSPTKHPGVRLQTIRDARRAEDPVHERDPGRHRRVRGGPDGVAGGARRATSTSRRSSSRTSSRTGATTARSRRRSPPRPPSASGPRASPTRRTATCRSGRARSNLDDMKRLVRRDAAADARTSASRSRRTSPTGGRSWSRRAPPTSAGCPPTATTSRPSTRSRARSRCASACRASPPSRERLCVYPQYMNEEWIAPRVLDVIEDRYRSFMPRRTQPRRRRRTRSSAPATAARCRRRSSRRCSPRAAPR